MPLTIVATVLQVTIEADDDSFGYTGSGGLLGTG